MVENDPPETIAGVSRSLKKLAEDHDDIVGLIAYGLFKSQQSEWADAVRPSHEEAARYHLTLQKTQIASLRANAEGKLSDLLHQLKSQFQDEIREEIQSEVDIKVVEGITKKIAEAVKREFAIAHRHSIMRDLLVAVGGWFVTLLITVLIVIVAYGPSIIDVVKRLMPSAGH